MFKHFTKENILNKLSILLLTSVLSINVLAQSGTKCGEPVKTVTDPCGKSTGVNSTGDTLTLFGGFSFLRLADHTLNPSPFGRKTSAYREAVNLNGWNASLAYRFSDYLSAVADFSGHYGDVQLQIRKPHYKNVVISQDANLHGFHFGLKADRSLGNGRIYVQELPGVSRLSGDNREAVTKFSNILSAGYDWKVSKSISIRNELGYEYTRFTELDNSVGQHGFRFCVGVVYRR